MSDQTTINRLIGEDDLKQAINFLHERTKGQAPEQHETLLLLAARWEKMQRQEMENTEDPDELRREHSRIVKALIRLNNETFQPPRFLGSRRSRRFAVAGLAVLSAAVVFWMFQPRNDFESAIDLVCKRVAFTFLKGNSQVFGNEPLRQLRVQNFTQTGIQANRVWMDLDNDGAVYEKEAAVPEGLISLLPVPDAGGAEFSAGPLHLSSLAYAPGARLSIGTSAGNPRELQLDVLHSARTQGEFDFSDSLLFFANLVEISGPGLSGNPGQLAGLIVPAGASKIFVENTQSLATFYLEFKDSLHFSVPKMAVDDLDFSIKTGEERVSSLVSGQIRLTDGRGNAYRTVALEKNSELTLEPSGEVLVQELSVRPEQISLRLTGNFRVIRTGNSAALNIQNPLMGEWLWHNHSYTVLALGFALLAAFGVLWFGSPASIIAARRAA
ncbi:MAG: hypothetical protein IPH12_04510 [Saprospirales bacterium]|nr:hypothetical protein [Saprospirales bacterium]MBK8920327.1 hypothetical protein [Saprospirales bacterium]